MAPMALVGLLVEGGNPADIACNWHLPLGKVGFGEVPLEEAVVRHLDLPFGG